MREWIRKDGSSARHLRQRVDTVLKLQREEGDVISDVHPGFWRDAQRYADRHADRITFVNHLKDTVNGWHDDNDSLGFSSKHDMQAYVDRMKLDHLSSLQVEADRTCQLLCGATFDCMDNENTAQNAGSATDAVQDNDRHGFPRPGVVNSKNQRPAAPTISVVDRDSALSRQDDNAPEIPLSVLQEGSDLDDASSGNHRADHVGHRPPGLQRRDSSVESSGRTTSDAKILEHSSLDGDNPTEGGHLHVHPGLVVDSQPLQQDSPSSSAVGLQEDEARAQAEHVGVEPRLAADNDDVPSPPGRVADADAANGARWFTQSPPGRKQMDLGAFAGDGDSPDGSGVALAEDAMADIAE